MQKLIKNLAFGLTGILMLACCVGWGWNSSPGCNGDEVQEVVIKLSKTDYIVMVNLKPVGTIREPPEYRLENIETIKTFDNDKCHCRADLRITGPLGTDAHPVEYTVRPAGNDRYEVVLGRK